MTSSVTQTLPYDASEQDIVISVFTAMLRDATKDGGKKRKAGTKPPWWRDGSHEAAIFSHLSKWKHGEVHDKDSNAHPLVHLAWRALAIAYQEEHGKIDPDSRAAPFRRENGQRVFRVRPEDSQADGHVEAKSGGSVPDSGWVADAVQLSLFN
jgi:hypothetical protein